MSRCCLIFTASMACAGMATPAAAEQPALTPGDYACEVPGPTLEALPVAVPAEDFAILGASTYRAQGSVGTYLVSGEIVQFTSGPKVGLRLRRFSSAFVRVLDADGHETTVRCLRQSASRSR